ncbi:MAG: tetraacyldisaccharide 4'-kinase [Ignavibacteria bacterium]|nr:tetraacyldisaccharide 4'-kinase [Ignavibacteria bacterium]
MILLRVILIPFSLIYSFVIYLRNKLYDTGIFKSHKISVPVISIGNITTGGTGKTPLTILISKYFLDKGKKVGIVSRGYKRKSDEMVLVSDGKTINKDIEQSGDELVMISGELIKDHKNNFFIAAGKNRVQAAEYLINEFKPDVIILDDGFQHRKLKRDLDIVLIDSHNFLSKKFLNSFTLPSGILRESLNNLNRADLIIQNNKYEDIVIIPEFKKYDKDIIPMRYKTEYFIDNKNSILRDFNSKAIVFSGIADDNSFIEMVKESKLTISKIVKFSDHHNYTASDILSLKGIHSKGKIFITTEKDFVKIKQFTDFINDHPVYYLKMRSELAGNENILFSKLDECVK